MRDATGRYDNALVLGGTSDLAKAMVAKLIDNGTRHVILAGRRPAALTDTAKELGRDGVTIATGAFHADDPESHATALDDLWPATDVDLAVVAFGELPDEQALAAQPASAARVLTTNLGGAATALLELANRMTAQGHGTIVVFSSVASQRARFDNIVYAASKAGLDAFSQGLADRLVGTGVHLMIVRPGYVHTKMTEGIKPAPFATTSEKVAEDVMKGLTSGAGVVWSPGILKYLFTILKNVPLPVWRRISAR